MSQRNATLAIAIAKGLEHIATGLREWAAAQDALAELPTGQPIPPPEGDRLLRHKEVAEILGVSPSTVSKLVKDGHLRPHETVHARIAKSEVERFIALRGTGRP